MRWRIRLIIGLILSLSLISLFPSHVYATSYSAEKAYEHVKYLVQKIGPRPSGSKGEMKAAQYLSYVLEKYGWKVREQPFSKIIVNSNPLDFSDQTIRIVNSQNVIAELPGEKPDTIIIGAHYDTAGINAPGAVDNASGVGAVLELARVLAQEKYEMSYQIIFFGAEEYGLVGSNYYVSNADLSAVNWMLNVDMVGDPLELDIAGKKSAPPDLLSSLTEIARKQKLPFHLSRDFIVMTRESKQGGTSDFSPFLDQGIPAAGIGIAGRPSGYFHRPEDRLEQVSLTSMQKVGEYMEQLVTKVELSQSGPRVWDEFYIPLKLGQFVLVIPAWVLRLLLVLTLALSMSLLVHLARNKPKESWREYSSVLVAGGFISVVAVSLSWAGEIIWQKIKYTEIIWQAFPVVYLGYRLLVIGGLILIAGIIMPKLPLSRSPKVYWLVGNTSLTVGLIFLALIRIDLTVPLIFWVLIYALLLKYPNPLLVLVGPYFLFTMHWELLNSQQWQSFYEITHQYVIPFTILYAILSLPFVLSAFYVMAINKRVIKYSFKKLLVPLGSVIGLVTIGLGFVPSYTQEFPQSLIVSEEFNHKGESKIRISSPDTLPQTLLNDFNAQNTKEINIPSLRVKPPMDVKVAVVETQPQILNVSLNLNYDQEPYSMRLKLESEKPFEILSIDGFLPKDKLPRKIELKGIKKEKSYVLTIERTPPHKPFINFTVEANTTLKGSIQGIFPNNEPKLVLNLNKISVMNEIVYESNFEI